MANALKRNETKKEAAFGNVISLSDVLSSTSAHKSTSDMVASRFCETAGSRRTKFAVQFDPGVPYSVTKSLDLSGPGNQHLLFCMLALRQIAMEIPHFPRELRELIMLALRQLFSCPIIMTKMCILTELTLQIIAKFDQPCRLSNELTSGSAAGYIYFDVVPENHQFEMKIVNLVNSIPSNGKYLLSGVVYTDPRTMHCDGEFSKADRNGGLYEGPQGDCYYAYGFLWGVYVGCIKASSTDEKHFNETFYNRGVVIDVLVRNEPNRKTLSFRKNGARVEPTVDIPLHVPLYPMMYNFDTVLISYQYSPIGNV